MDLKFSLSSVNVRIPRYLFGV
jgi:hypothetical protein